jgi:hypothetical protein
MGNSGVRPNLVLLPVAIVVVPERSLANFVVEVVRQKVPPQQLHLPMPEWCLQRIVGQRHSTRDLIDDIPMHMEDVAGPKKLVNKVCVKGNALKFT